MNIIERTLNDITVLDLKGNIASEGNKQFRRHVAATIDDDVCDPIQKESQGSDAISKPHLIHLKGAKTYQSGAGPPPSEKGVLWRERLEAVDGFSLGRVSLR
jgi:hypothetical protein